MFQSQGSFPRVRVQVLRDAFYRQGAAGGGWRGHNRPQGRIGGGDGTLAGNGLFLEPKSDDRRAEMWVKSRVKLFGPDVDQAVTFFFAYAVSYTHLTLP